MINSVGLFAMKKMQFILCYAEPEIKPPIHTFTPLVFP